MPARGVPRIAVSAACSSQVVPTAAWAAEKRCRRKPQSRTGESNDLSAELEGRRVHAALLQSPERREGAAFLFFRTNARWKRETFSPLWFKARTSSPAAQWPAPC